MRPRAYTASVLQPREAISSTFRFILTLRPNQESVQFGISPLQRTQTIFSLTVKTALRHRPPNLVTVAPPPGARATAAHRESSYRQRGDVRAAALRASMQVGERRPAESVAEWIRNLRRAEGKERARAAASSPSLRPLRSASPLRLCAASRHPPPPLTAPTRTYSLTHSLARSHCTHARTLLHTPIRRFFFFRQCFSTLFPQSSKVQLTAAYCHLCPPHSSPPPLDAPQPEPPQPATHSAPFKLVSAVFFTPPLLSPSHLLSSSN